MPPKRKRTVATYSKSYLAKRARTAAYRRPSYTRATAYAAAAERKFWDGAKANSTIGAAGEVNELSLNLIPQGVTESTRVGRKCTVKQILIRGDVKLPSAIVKDSNDRIRILVYLDKQANGATAAVLDLLEAATIDSFRNLAESSRFNVLMDKTIDLNKTAAAGDGTTNDFEQYFQSFKFFKNCNIPLQFNSTTGAISEISSNNIGVIAITHQGKAQLAYNWRLRYSDK